MLWHVGARHGKLSCHPQTQSVHSLPQTRMKQGDVQLYPSVDIRSSTTRTQGSLESHTVNSSPSAYMRPLSAARWSSKLGHCGAWRPLIGAMYIRSTYIATGRTTVEYAAAEWLPWVLLSTMETLEMCQRYAGRAITGQIKMTPV